MWIIFSDHFTPIHLLYLFFSFICLCQMSKSQTSQVAVVSGLGCPLCLFVADSILWLQDNYREIVFNLSNYLIPDARQIPLSEQNAILSEGQFSILSMMSPMSMMLSSRYLISMSFVAFVVTVLVVAAIFSVEIKHI